MLGLASAAGVIFIWSGFIVFSRAGVTTSLTAYDITALRFMVGGGLVLPFLLSWWPRHLPLRDQIMMSICGPGALYTILMYLGLTDSSAAWGGVFANGSLPVFTTLLGVLVSRDFPGRKQLLAIGVIVAGGVTLGYPQMVAGGQDVLSAIVLFLSASAVLSVYIFGIRRCQLTPRQALALVNLPNAVIFLPLWFFFLPSGLADTEMSTILFQALFQGIGPGFLAVILTAMTAIHLGPTLTAGFSAVVPATAALLAIPVLYEYPTGIEWIGIAVVTAGLVVLVVGRK
jgi:drug/metabolite transporter (DMT)-like permease